MAVIDRATFLTKAQQFIDTTGNEGTTGPEIKELFDDLAQSVIFQDEATGLVGFTTYDPGLTYQPGNPVIQDGQFYVCISADTTGAFDIAKWRKLPVLAFIFTFAEWNEGTPYVLGNEVRRHYKVYRALGATTGNDPVASPGQWEEIFVNDGTFGNVWTSAYYLSGHIIKYHELYLLSTADFYSSDIEADIAAGNFVNLFAQEFRKKYTVSFDDFTIDEPAETAELVIDNLPSWARPVLTHTYHRTRWAGGALSSVLAKVMYREWEIHNVTAHTTTDTLKAKSTITYQVSYASSGPGQLRLRLEANAEGNLQDLIQGEMDITVIFKTVAWDEV